MSAGIRRVARHAALRLWTLPFWTVTALAGVPMTVLPNSASIAMRPASVTLLPIMMTGALGAIVLYATRMNTSRPPP